MHQISVDGFCVANILRDALELRARNTGDTFDLFRIPLLHFLARIFKAVHALPDELLVLPAVLDDVPHDSVQHRNVGAGPDAHIFGGMRRGARQSRIDHDDVRLVHLGAFEQVLQRHRMGLGRVAAHDHLRLRIADVGVAVRHRAVAPGIGHARDGSRMADARLMVRVVGAPEGAHFAEQIRTFVRHLGRTEPVNRVAARLLADRHELVADLIDGNVPRHALPLPAGELHRIFQAALAAPRSRALLRPWRNASRG